MINSIEEIIDELSQHKLLDDELIAEACHVMERRGDAGTVQDLLALLIEEGNLTPYQADEVGHGRANQLVLGNYLVLSRIGEGGMGTVFRALHRRMQRVVALKIIRKEIASVEFISRFRREIQLSARLNHPNVVVAYDSDQCVLGDFLVMEYVDGTDLLEVLKRTGPLSIDDAMSAVRQAALALGYAHQQGIVHRDIKPSNLLRDVNGNVKVVDLGIACALQWTANNGPALTKLGEVAGTVDFMSPEQAERPEDVDGRSDIYSLGCTLFTLLTSGPVFASSNVIGRILAHRSAPPPQLSVVRHDAPAALNAVFQKMVAKSPDDRFATMEEVVSALDAINQPNVTSGRAHVPVQKDREVRSQAITVLVVEDSRLQVGMIGRMLSDIGITEVHHCRSGDEVLQRIAMTLPTVLLSSIRLPDMSGLVLATRIRETYRWLKMGIVLMSGDNWNSQRRSAAEQIGRLQLLKKPFDAEGLRRAIEKALKDDAFGHRPLQGLDNLQVLIVDDSSLARRHEKSILSELGIKHFTEAEDGEIAVKEMEQNHFDLIVTDYHMPRMDGRQLISYIRQRGPQREVPVIMVTTEFNPQKLASVYQLGVSAICNKSFDLELVRNVVMSLFA